VPYGHILIAFSSLEKGLSKLLLNPKAIENALDKNCIVVAEAIQTVLRREGYTNPYEKLKELTRTNESITMKLIHEFVDTLDVKKELKAELKKITPHNYVGKS
jgi:adenylosuccinate lyase